MSGYRVVYVEPGKPAVEKEIGTKLENLQEAVGGLIECIYAHNDGTIIVGNDEAKLLGMEGNRRLDSGSIIAGPFIVIGEAGENFRSLTDEEVSRYLQVYAEPTKFPSGRYRRIWALPFYVSERCAMKIKARIDRMVNTGNVKAIASVSLDGMFVVKNLKVMDGKKGPFVSMPQESYSGKDGQKKYSNTFFALTNSAKLALQESVLQAYQQQIDPNYAPKQSYGDSGYPQEVQHQRDYYPQPQYPEPQYPDWVNECDDGMLPMEMGGM